MSQLHETLEQESGVDEWSISIHKQKLQNIPSLATLGANRSSKNSAEKTNNFSIGAISSTNSVFQHSINVMNSTKNSFAPKLSTSQK